MNRRAPEPLIGVSCPLLLFTLIFVLPLKTNIFISLQNLEQGWLAEPLVFAPVLLFTDSVCSEKLPPEQGLMLYVSVWGLSVARWLLPLSFLIMTVTGWSATMTSGPLYPRWSRVPEPSQIGQVTLPLASQ